MKVYVKISLISIFTVFFPVFNHDVVIYIFTYDFTHVAASNPATDDVTN